MEKIKKILTQCVDAKRQFCFFAFCLFAQSAIASGVAAEENYGRAIQFLELPPTIVNFKFSKEERIWISSEDQWKKFWKDHSRIDGDAPVLNLNWTTQSLLALFWESKDDVIRIPLYQGIEEWEENGKKSLRHIFSLNKPCFGIITDNSPAKFLIMDKNISDVDSITVRTEESKASNCM